MKSKQNTSLMIKAIMLLLALIIMVFVASLAWFTENTTAEASGLSVKTEAPNKYKIAVGFKNKLTNGDYLVSEYTQHFDLRKITIKNDETDEETEYDILADFRPRDVTGDGITLVRPDLVNKNKDINKDGYGVLGRANEDYISFDLYVQSPTKCRIYLDNETKAYGLKEVEGGKLAETSGSTEFSPDAIVGALRVSFIDYAEATNYIFKEEYLDVLNTSITAPNALWIPRSDIRFDDSGDEAVLYTDIQDYLSPNASFVSDDELMNTYKHTYFDFDLKNDVLEPQDYKVADDAITTTITGLSKSNIPICDVIYEGTDDAGNDCFYGKVQVNIWLEGCDSEARRVMNSGQFFIDFDIISKDY